MAVILKIGSFDCSTYIRLNPDDHFDPYGAPWLEPSFSESPFADGQPLSSLDVKNREMSWPLFISDTSKTKDALHALIRNLNNAFLARPLQVEWRDEGATASTFYDVEYARFEPDYGFRRSQKGYGGGVLRVWVRGYGHTGTTRVVGTVAGTGLVKTVPLASLAGDGPVLLDARVTVGSQVPFVGRIVGVAALPSSYVAEIPPGSFLNLQPGASVIGASGAPASAYLGAPPVIVGQGTAPVSFAVALSPASVYIGANRVLVAVKTGKSPGLAVSMLDDHLRPVGPTALATALDKWSLIDAGVARVPTTGPATAVFNFRLGGAQATGMAQEHYATFTGSYLAEIGDVLVLPEDRFSMVMDSPRLPVGFDSFDPGATQVLVGQYDRVGNQWATSGDNLISMLEHDHVLYPQATGGRQLAAARLNTALVRDLWMRTAAGFDTPGVSIVLLELRKELNATNMLIGRVVTAGSRGSMAAAIVRRTNSVDTTLATAAIPSTSVNDTHVMALRCQGPVAGLTVYPKNVEAAGASVVASDALFADPGQPGLAVAAGTAAQTVAPDFFAAAMPSRAIGARDIYHFDGVGLDVWQANASDLVLQSLAAKQVGRVPQLKTTDAQVAAFALSVDDGPGNDLLSVDVRIRERFFYSQ